MGFFSWKTADTQESIRNTYAGDCKPVYLLQPNADAICEPGYEGYGVFNGHDALVWLAKANLPDSIISTKSFEDLRTIGIRLLHGMHSFVCSKGTFVAKPEKPILLALGVIHDDSVFIEYERENDAVSLAEETITVGDISYEQRHEIKPALQHPLKFSFNKDARYDRLPASESCEYQGYFYPEDVD